MPTTRAVTVIAAAVAVLSAGSGTALGELLHFSAVLDTRCQEFVAGEPVSFDQSFEEFEVTSAELPIRVTSSLWLPTASGLLVATAQGFADFYEPGVRLDRNPAELALEANCFSIDPEVAYQVTASIHESRTIRLSRAELHAEGSGAQDVISTVFLSGAIIVWSQDPTRDLGGLSAELAFDIEQFPGPDQPQEGEPGQTGPQAISVFHSAFGVTGAAEGEVYPFIEGKGTFLFGGPDLVRELAGPDAPPDEFDRMGQVSVMVIPVQELTYQYRAHPGEEFELLASVHVEVTNLPDGTGISAVFGRDFQALRRLIEEAFPGLDGTGTQSAVNLAQAKAQAPHQAVPEQPLSAPTTNSRLCGTVGPEAVAMLPLVVLLPAALTRRRR